MSNLLIFDTELTGVNPFKHAMVELGATLYDLKEDKHIDTFKRIINMPEGTTWHEPTLTGFWLNPAKVSRPRYEDLRHKVENGKGTNMSEAITEFYEFVRKCYEKTGEDMVIGSDRLDVDCTWANHFLAMYDLPLISQISGKDRRLIDLHSYHQGASLTDHVFVKEFERSGKGYDPSVGALNYFNVTERTKTYRSHDALDDSKNRAESHALILKAIRNIKAPAIHMSSVHQRISYSPPREPIHHVFRNNDPYLGNPLPMHQHHHQQHHIPTYSPLYSSNVLLSPLPTNKNKT